MEGTIREQNRRIQEMETNLAQRAPVTPTPPPDPDTERQEFYNNPKEATRKLLREELDASIGPIAEFVKQFKGATAIDKYVEQFKLDPRFQNLWDPQVEQYVREQSGTIPPDKLNDTNFGFLVVSAIGLKATGMLQSFAPPAASAAPVAAPTTPTPTAAPSSMPTPPHMRPSPPAGPTPGDSNGGKKIRPLNENELRLLREYNAGKPPSKQMTHEQFLVWQDMPSADVARADFDLPKPAAR